ncbi:PREDICTED: uncharacterized protein K02A2.6-like [Priapulus caudatus]|uniref:RNA-directed DNA polymerase n=1 Tax=Priapulus caudatus TaxID=37621 RepID=A0ABM1DZ65_PRICU|nr:PREDICTED: uncharacterized protein K02A2.6-like [Priapulus caudatus]
MAESHSSTNVDAIGNSRNFDRHRSKSQPRQCEVFTFHAVNNIRDWCDQAFVKIDVQIRHKPANLMLKVDTGAQANLLPMRTYRAMFPDTQDANLIPSQCRLVAYNGTPIKCLGTIAVPCRYKDSEWDFTDFFLVDVPGPAILGLPSCSKMNVVILHCAIEQAKAPAHRQPTVSSKPVIKSIDDLKERYPNRFDRIGEFKSIHKLAVDPNRPPSVDKAKLDEMVEQGVIRQIEEPTEWVSTITYVTKKDGSIRICLDPRHLNRALIRPRHVTPTIDDINHKLATARVFSKLNAKSGYWAVKLHEESQELTTFQTPFGRYCFCRLPFGLSVSQDIFQLEMDRIIERCPGVCGISDDIIVYGDNDAEHDTNLLNLMEVAGANGLVFNSPKCSIKQSSIEFFGNVYTDQGMKPDPKKVADLRAMPEPVNKTELHQFLGLMTYLSCFIEDYSTKSAALRDLLRQDVDFIWEAHHQKVFENLKNTVSDNSLLRYFNPKKETYLQCDASLRGLGAALLQPSDDDKLKPIAFASKSLTPTEQRYACIERELLAVVFGVQRFHMYLYGRTFTAITDHKPLVMILDKPLAAAPPRLQRLMVKLQGYNLRIVYRPGRENQLADGLSRLPSPANATTIDLDLRVDHTRFTASSQAKLRDEMRQDETLNHLREIIVTGWPDDMKDLPNELKPYWSYRDELTVHDGLVIKGRRILIPKGLRQDTLQQLHAGHFGREKTLLLARETVFWPNVTKDIIELVAKCETCQEAQPSQPAEPLLPHAIPPRPWHTLATDLFEYDGSHYLVVGDYYTKFPLVRKMPSRCPSRTVIAAMKQMFGEHGIPERVVSDNGPHYNSQEYRAFAAHWGFEIVTTSPRRPKGNGFIERTVQTVKHTLKKAKGTNTDFDLALLMLRATPISNKLASPAELLLGIVNISAKFQKT